VVRRARSRRSRSADAAPPGAAFTAASKPAAPAVDAAASAHSGSWWSTMCAAPSRCSLAWLVALAVAVTRAPRAAARATSRPPVTPPPPWIRRVSRGLISTPSDSAWSAVSAGTGNAAAAAQDIAAGFPASSPAGAISCGAHAPPARSGRGWVRTSSPGAQSWTAAPTAVTVPAASTPNAIAGAMPTSQPP
jgi:hypothetical protein